MAADTFPVNGLDWASGLTVDDAGGGSTSLPGTQTPFDARAQISNGELGFIYEERPDSPEIERAEQGTIRHTFKVDEDTGLAMLQGTGRGRFLTDSFGNVSRVLSCRLNHIRGDHWSIEVVAESISFDTPLDEFDVAEVEENLDIIFHPRYAPVRNYNLNSSGVATGTPSGYQIINAIRTAGGVQNYAQVNDGMGRLTATDYITDATVRALAVEAANKLRKGETEFYFAGLRVTWSQYYWLPPLMNPGGYIENPVTQGSVPAYFWSDTGEPGGANTLEDLGVIINPDIYGDGFSWLRRADSRQYQRIWHKINRSWIGGPLLHWDTDIYPHVV